MADHGPGDMDDRAQPAKLDADTRQVIESVTGRDPDPDSHHDVNPMVERGDRGPPGNKAGDAANSDRPPVDRALLVRSWTRVPEDDRGGLEAYRPSDAELPPARGRTSLELAPDGGLRVRSPGADDRAVTRGGGSWELQGRSLIVRSEGGLAVELRVDLLSPDLLLVQRILPEGEGEPHG